MVGASSSSNPPRPRKRMETETNSLKRARNGSAFTRCDDCNKDVAVALIDMHNCSLDSKIRMNLQAVEMPGYVKKPAARQSSTRSKERMIRYIADLERKVQILQTEANTLSAQLTMSQRDTNCLAAENNELKLRLQSMEQQVHLQNDFG